MTDVEVHIDIAGETRPVGLLRRQAARRRSTVTFEYASAWLDDPNRFSIEPALALTRGVFPAPPHQEMFGSIGDSAPDAWGGVSCSAPSGVRPSARAAWSAR